ncbi:MAG: sugar ABC transporter ATP-binding protein [Lachnospiraceae bacterium]|nr:sugar ABC transporter ATP-binding protein [Lachnospiraceae bacterium]
MSNVLIELKNIKKAFGPTIALSDVSCKFYEGEIHGLIGENGSGKSTLSAVIAGIHQPDSGTMFLKGASYEVADSIEAYKKGLCIVLQEQGTFFNTTVAENIFVGLENNFGKAGAVSHKKMNAKAEEILNDIGAGHIKPSVYCSDLSFEDRKLVEIARTMYSDPQLLIIDETTTALSQGGRKILYSLMSRLRDQGKTVIMISHDIDEVISLCDRVTVLRDGHLIDTMDKEKLSPHKIRNLMVGREISDKYYRTDYLPMEYQNAPVVLELRNVTSEVLNDVTLQIHEGEILGLGGLTDCGMHEIGKLLFGDIKPIMGKVLYKGEKALMSPEQAVKCKIAYLSKDRDKESLMTYSTIFDNVSLPSLKKLSKKGFLTNKVMKQFADYWGDVLKIKMKTSAQFVNELSGGNKQKVAISKWLGFDAEIFIMDCPTRGIDVGVKSAIYELMGNLKRAGKSIVLISEELPELIGMCDKILILKDGEVTGEFLRSKNLNEHNLIEYMI